MRRSIAVTVGLVCLLASGLVAADTINNTRVIDYMGQSFRSHEALNCTYGEWRLLTNEHGVKLITRDKVCSGTDTIYLGSVQ